MRILDLDLDFFVEGAAHWKTSDGERLDAIAYPPWPLEDAIAFSERSCGLTGKLPRFAVEHHGELFGAWRKAIEIGKLEPPFSVTHVDAHADLGLGDGGFIYLMSELLFEPLAERQFPRTDGGGLSGGGLGDGNWLSFAVACRWISDITYVFNAEEDHPGDIMPRVMEGFSTRAEHIQLAAMEREELRNIGTHKTPDVKHLEPKVPFRSVPRRTFQTPEPFDLICLTRSPGFTPAESDALYEEIQARFIDEGAF